MPQIVVQFEKSTLDAIDRIAPAAKRRRAEFIREAVKEAIFRKEQSNMRAAYRQQTDSADEADTWELPEEWD
jgi:metal-responsive CopG/Arc/MetJ family transcriptional regulator